MTIEEIILGEVKRIRARLGQVESIANYSIHIHATGRTNSPDILITYAVGDLYNDSVKGNSLEPCVTEFLRRNGWKQEHSPKLISYEDKKVDFAKELDDEIPFE